METAELLSKQPISVRLAKSYTRYNPDHTKNIRVELIKFFLYNLGDMFTVEEVWRGIGERSSIAALGSSIRDLRRFRLMKGYPLDIEAEETKINGKWITKYGLKSK